MRRMIAVSTSVLLLSVGLQAQGKGRASVHTQAPAHGNAPAGTPHASADRDLGKDRAEDVGRGKKAGLDHKKRNKGKAKAKGKNGSS